MAWRQLDPGRIAYAALKLAAAMDERPRGRVTSEQWRQLQVIAAEMQRLCKVSFLALPGGARGRQAAWLVDIARQVLEHAYEGRGHG